MPTQRVMPLITVRDLDAAIEAYRRLTGMEVVMNHGNPVSARRSFHSNQFDRL